MPGFNETTLPLEGGGKGVGVTHGFSKLSARATGAGRDGRVAGVSAAAACGAGRSD